MTGERRGAYEALLSRQLSKRAKVCQAELSAGSDRFGLEAGP